MRPSRCAAKTAESRDVIHSLAYAFSTMVEREAPCTQGVALLANMMDFTMSNFATDYWFQFMSILQGQVVPVRVNLFLIVNPPEWFGTIWNIMKTMLTVEFQERVRMISELELPQYLAVGYEEFLPNDMTTGKALTDELIGDFVNYRKAIEAAQGHNNKNNCNTPPGRQQSLRRSSSSSSRDLGSSLNNLSLRRSLSLEDSDSSLRCRLTKSMSSSCRAMASSEQKPPMSKQRSGVMSKQRSARALAADVRMNMSMPCIMSKPSTQKTTNKRHSSENTASTNEEPRMVRNSSAALGNIDCVGDDDDNSSSSLNLLDLEKTSDVHNNHLVEDVSISEQMRTVEIMRAVSSSSTSRLPSTVCC
jgi:hypothetical protein